MKQKTKELDVDFIGGQKPMTKKEALLISEFIKSRKLIRERKQKRTSKAKQRTSVKK